MSFITKRERVFNEHDLFDLPARNEGKLKAYASCTDARAWSHFCSDKSEHLVEIIKRNNETVRPKYFPTDVIVDTLMVAKNAEIARLKHKIEEFEQMLAAYDQLELSCDQKCEIAHAHAAIKAANKELDDLCLDLDLSGFTEGIDSEGFATGKSRGDEATPRTYEVTPRTNEVSPKTIETLDMLQEYSLKKDTRGVQNDLPGTRDVATFAKDSRIDEMQDTIITKDAKLNAMKNTIAVMENDVCEPYCIYAHIYTALEKIFGILCQNDKYRQYLKLLTAGKDTRCIDVKGKILFKLKVLEKFCCALIAPCTQDFVSHSPPRVAAEDCACYRVDVIPRTEPAFALTSSEAKQPNFDNKRAHLVADIIENDEMKEILNKEGVKPDEDVNEDVFALDSYNIETENLKRLKSLQENFDDLMTCYETLKHEKESLEKRCNKYEELEHELESLKTQMREYNSLWNEKEHYRKRSADLDTLKEQYLILTDETTNLETQLKAESEINNIKCKALEGLRNENIILEKKINEASIAFEKEKNILLCKLKEADCRVMCQGQQIKSLTTQVDKLLEHNHEKLHPRDSETRSLVLMDEIESSKEQIKNLKEALFCNEEEKQELQKHYQDQLEIINVLKSEIENWRSSYERTVQHKDELEKYSESLRQDIDDKMTANDNLMSIIHNKSQEINKLMQDIEKKKDENKDLLRQLNELRNRFDSSLSNLQQEKMQALQSLQVARQESQELLEKVKNYDQALHIEADVTKSLEIQLQEKEELHNLLMNAIEENRNLKADLASRENNNSILLQEIQRLRDVNEYAVDSINNLQDEKNKYRMSLDFTQKESTELKDKIMHYENLMLKLHNLQESHEKLIEEKSRLEGAFLEKSYELENAIHTIQLTKRESAELIDRLQQAEGSKDNELSRISEAYQKLSSEKYAVQKDLIEKRRDMDNLVQTLNNMKADNQQLIQKCNQFEDIEQELTEMKKKYAELMYDFENKTEEINHLYNTLENKIEENRELTEQIKTLEINQVMALEDEKIMTEAKLNIMKKESAELLEKIKQYQNLETEFEKLKAAHDQMKIDKENLQIELNTQMADLKRMEQENSELHSHSQNLLSHSEDLEHALIGARTELIKKGSSSPVSHKEIIGEIEILRQEKLLNQKKMRELLDKLEESENIISSLSEDVCARDDKIATLQNHINELEEEVRRLHGNLAEVINTGEEIKDFGLRNINSIRNMEAHHSKATHNMKMEIAKLQQENSMLSEQLSVTKVQSEESSRDMFKYVSQIKHLQNEREIIVTDIKQLELKSVGDSVLAPNNCEIEEILSSLDRIRKSFDARTNKSSTLERTLLKVQTSSQLLLSKADEAKKIVEREKQKIIFEKEEAIRDRQNMETQLFDLRAMLEKQVADDKAIIVDLEATIANQTLITDRLKKSTQDYIAKLKDELQTLKNLYQDSVEKISELQEKLHSVTEDKRKLNDMMEEIKTDLGNKSNEVSELQKQLEVLQKKTYRNMETQIQRKDLYQNVGCQTDTLEPNIFYGSDINASKDIPKTKDFDFVDSIDMMELNKPPLDKRHTQLEMKLGSPLLNEVNILSAAVDQPTFEALKNSYIDYKMKRLSPGRFEQYSITCFTDKEKNENKATTNTVERATKKTQKSAKRTENANTQSNNLIDIYNRRSMQTNSSKAIDESDNIVSSKMVSQSQGKSTGYPTRESYETDSNLVSKYKDSKTYVESTSDKSTDKDLFVIYKDSESSYNNNNNNKKETKGTWSGKGHSEIVVEAVTVHPTKKGIAGDHPKNYGKETFIFQENDENGEDDSVKHKLKIKLPRVETESPSLITASDIDKKSLDSYTLAIDSSQKRLSDSDTKINENLDSKKIKQDTPSMPTISNEDNLGSYNSLGVGSDEDVVRPMKSKALETDSGTSKHKNSKLARKKVTVTPHFDSESHHKLSRVGADVLLLKAEKEKKYPKVGNFGLEYIMDTMQAEVDPEGKYYAGKEARKTRSDERFNLVKIREKTDSSPSRLSEFKISSTEYKTMSTNSKSSQPKSFVERSIMAKLDINEDYEVKISSLTKALENIEKDYKKKIEAIKMQYDSNIKSIINEHNQGVQSIQSLHEETLQDIIKLHENEVENLRSMSIEAMRKADKLEKENRALKTKVQDCGTTYSLDEEPVKITPVETKKRKRSRDTRLLTKTTVEAFNVKPKTRSNGPCTCSLDVNVSDTIRNIFEQVDVEQRKMAEHTYLKYIANKILNGSLDDGFKSDGLQTLDAQELSFLHLKVCRTWKTKLSKEEALQKRIDSLENELMSKQRNAQQHIAELDRKVAEERRRLQEVREAVCRTSPVVSRCCSPDTAHHYRPPLTSPATVEKDPPPGCNPHAVAIEVGGRRSAGDLVPEAPAIGIRVRRNRLESNRAVLARLDVEERKEKRIYNDEPPTRLRRSHDRPTLRSTKK
ncbi:myosin-2 heavy chain-like [Helicoverpa zea]|uniref:myosin-2 heavy chain-like n=1 Tax=Helicoverpa zea TaxID=7113 RepID=UPI001F58427B|nr:myosin-2 heavy chain-like [Helicoverpa zea]